jgi:protein SCO1
MRISHVLALALSIAALAGCSEKTAPGGSEEMVLSPVKSSFKNTDLTGLNYGNDFALKDHTGQIRKLADFKGNAVIVFFGFTHCPDVCPTTLAELATVMKELGPLADKVQVLFITVDPERDTPELLAKYVPAFDPRFLGLVGTVAETEQVAKQFKAFYQKVPGKTAGSYTVDHTAGSYIFDPQGRIRLFVRHGQGTEPIVHDLKLLLSGA